MLRAGGDRRRVGALLQIDLRVRWQPDETFCDLLTDKDALARIGAEMGAAPAAKATGKDLRGLIRRRLQGEGCPPVAHWLPRYFKFPSRGYTDRPVSEARAAYDRLARDGNGDGDSAAVVDGAGEEITAGRAAVDQDECHAAAEFDRAA